MPDDAAFNAFVQSIIAKESGGNPKAIGQPTPYGTATGKYQVLDSTWAGYGGYTRAADAPESVQDAFATAKLRGYYDQFGAAGAAVAWYAGPATAASYVADPTNPKWSTAQSANGVAMPSIASYATGITGASTLAAGGNVTTTGSGLGPTSTPDEIRKYINDNLPQESYLLNNPEVFNTIVQWAHDDAPDADLVSRIKQTDYWKTNAPQSRAWDDLRANDPEAAKEKAFSTAAMVQRAYQQAGVTISQPDSFQVAEQFIRSGWTADDLNRYMVNSGAAQGQTTNKALTDAQSMIAEAGKYGVTMTQQTANNFATQIQAGSMSSDGFNTWLQSQAQNRWSANPDVLASMKNGVTPYDYFSPQRQAIASKLELNPNTVDVFDGQFGSASSFYDPAAKVTRSMTANEAGLLALKDDRVKQTSWYQQQDAQWANQIALSFQAAPSGG